MKKPILLLYLAVASIINVQSQAGQFAVVKPNGTTQIYTSWTSAYAEAVDEDFMYLPGVTISVPVTINKKLFIYGTGHDPDSTTATARTIFSSTFSIQSGATGGLLEGIKAAEINLGGTNKLQNYTIKKCNISSLIFTSNTPDSMPQYITLSESIVGNVSNSYNCAPAKYCSFFKNIFVQKISCFQSCTFKNNNFLCFSIGISPPCNSLSNSSLENNIFLDDDPAPIANGNCDNIFLNNLKLNNSNFTGSESCPVSQADNMSVPTIYDIFINYSGSGFLYTDDYHLIPTCPGVGAGTDGTDVGIYGTINPTVEGWIPSNPHIYFKQVAPETGPDGKLHIQVGVRANNN